jgi:hypothetical protein
VQDRERGFNLHTLSQIFARKTAFKLGEIDQLVVQNVELVGQARTSLLNFFQQDVVAWVRSGGNRWDLFDGHGIVFLLVDWWSLAVTANGAAARRLIVLLIAEGVSLAEGCLNIARS